MLILFLQDFTVPRPNYLKNHLGPSAYKFLSKPSENLGEPVKITIIDDQYDSLHFPDLTEISNNLDGNGSEHKSKSSKETLSNNFHNGKSKRRYWRLKSIKGARPSQTNKSQNKINQINDINSNDLTSDCPFFKQYQYIGKPILEDNFTNSH